MRRVPLLVILLGSLTLAAAAQQPSPTPRFDVASIRLWSPPTTPVTSVRVTAAPVGSGIFNRSTNVARLIAEAYEVQDFQLSGGEDWVRTERYDVSARAGLTGQWRFNVYFGSELSIPGRQPEPANPDLPSFVGALQEQLGLRLERTRGPVPVVVIESVERPTPN